MLYLLFTFLFFALALLVFGYLTNRARVKDIPDFDLQPNCLLTRWPLVFLTGPRSFFYCKNYWNLFPVFLAEHGYEVFHLPLPWKRSPNTFKKLALFLQEHATEKRPLHLVMDSALYSELMEQLDLDRHIGIASISVISHQPLVSKRLSPTLISHHEVMMAEGSLPKSLSWAYRLHKAISGSQSLPSLSALGARSDVQFINCQRLLQHAHSLAEYDVTH